MPDRKTGVSASAAARGDALVAESLFFQRWHSLLPILILLFGVYVLEIFAGLKVVFRCLTNRSYLDIKLPFGLRGGVGRQHSADRLDLADYHLRGPRDTVLQSVLFVRLVLLIVRHWMNSFSRYLSQFQNFMEIWGASALRGEI